ncbi:MAG: CHAT domain-containing protein, partial [Bacteroidales bacterium]|nr:CHAT domain-containing protein [Bacteroidales bacterium]
NIYLNFGRFLNISGDLYNALDYYNKAESIYLSKFGNEYSGLAPLYFNKGSIFILLNDINKALSYHEQALELYKNNINPTNSIFNKLDGNFGLIYKKLGKYDIAIDFYQNSLEGNSNSETIVITLRNLADCYFKTEDTSRAELYYTTAIDKSESLLGKDHIQTANSYLSYGSFCSNTEKYSKVFKLLNQSYKIFHNKFGSKNRDVSNVLTQMGNHFSNIKNYQQSLNYLQLALISFIEDFNNTNIYVNPLFEKIEPDINVFNSFYNKSFSFYNYYNTSHNIQDLTACLESSNITIQLIEKIRSSFEGEESKLLVTNDMDNIFNLAIIASIEMYELTNEAKFINTAFEYSEKGKAAVLLSSIRELEALQVGNIPEDILLKEKILKKELNSYKNKIYEEGQKISPDSLKLVAWKKALFKKQANYVSLISSFEKNYSDYYDLKYNFGVVCMKDIQQQLSQAEALIEYKIADSVLISFFISADTIILLKSLLNDDFSEQIENFISLINKFPNISNSNEDFNKFSKLSSDLYNILLKPIELSSRYKDLIIIPDDILGYLSFDALISDKPEFEKADYRKLEYFIKAHSISYSYSGSLLFKHQLKKKNNKKLLAMAPTYNAIISDNLQINERDIRKNLNSLEYTSSEVESINSVFRGKTLIGESATEYNFKSKAGKYNILHFAMHTLINDKVPLASKLVFSYYNDTVEDGFLNTYEIYNLDLNAELAVLSACETGIGKLSKGEGIMSLARGFMYAGVPGIVMTLWAVEDIAGAQIITEFYINLKKGLKKDVALRNAKLVYLESANQLEAHPYFWAAYVQIGDNSTVTAYSNIKYYLIVIAIIAIFGSFYLVRVLRSRKSN